MRRQQPALATVWCRPEVRRKRPVTGNKQDIARIAGAVKFPRISMENNFHKYYY